MTTPADELRAAAALLRERATAATPGPWHRPLNTRYKSHVSAPLPDGERGSWIDGIDPTTGERERSTVVSVPIWSDGRHARKRGGRDLEYIALMDPALGLLLADWLDAEARGYEAATHLAELNEGHIEVSVETHPDGRPCYAYSAHQHALAVARQINTGGQS